MAKHAWQKIFVKKRARCRALELWLLMIILDIHYIPADVQGTKFHQ